MYYDSSVLKKQLKIMELWDIKLVITIG
jgi:hypothetical protein